MTNAAMAGSLAAMPGEAPRPEPAPSPRGLARRAVDDTLASWRTKTGLAWIAIVAFCAVFAPFLANSYPLAVKMNGNWSSPAIKHLTPVDWTLLVVAFCGVITLGLSRLTFFRKLLVLLLILAVELPLAFLFVHPPIVDVFQEYRDLQRQGRLQAVIGCPIPYSPTDRLRDHPDARLTPPSREHLFGVDMNGSDVLSAMIHACRIAMAIGFISTGIAVVIGVVIGGLMGYFVGWVDLFGMRFIEVFEAIPTLILLITFVAFFGHNLYLMMAIIGLTGWTGNARFIRAEYLRLRNQDFVQATIAAGLPLRSILFRHMLPNGVSPVIVSATFGIASAILFESTLSFLGLGLIDEPSWGQMLNQAAGVSGTFTWWMAVFPGLGIFLTVFAYNLIGEALRDALDPRLHGIE
jgi:peptide/nickel transport system permease protein